MSGKRFDSYKSIYRSFWNGDNRIAKTIEKILLHEEKYDMSYPPAKELNSSQARQSKWSYIIL